MRDRKTEQVPDLGALCHEVPLHPLHPLMVAAIAFGCQLPAVLLGLWLWHCGYHLLIAVPIVVLGVGSTVCMLYLEYVEGPGRTQVFERGILYQERFKVIVCRWDHIAWVRVYTERQGFCIGTKGGPAFGYNGILYHWPDILALIEAVRSHVSALPSPPEWVEESGYE